MIFPTYLGELNKNSQYKRSFICKQSTHLKWCLIYALNTKLLLKAKGIMWFATIIQRIHSYP